MRVEGGQVEENRRFGSHARHEDMVGEEAELGTIDEVRDAMTDT